MWNHVKRLKRFAYFLFSFSPVQPLSESNLFSFWVTAGIWILDIANCYRGTFGLDVSHRAVLGLLFVNECDAGDHRSRTQVSRSPHCFLLDFNPAGEWTCTPVNGNTSYESCLNDVIVILQTLTWDLASPLCSCVSDSLLLWKCYDALAFSGAEASSHH